MTWKVIDGYLNHGPQRTQVDDTELDDCESNDEREELIAEAIQNDFEQKVSWEIISRK